MDGVTLLRRAQEAGLRVEAVGSELRIRGPKQAEAVVKLLAANKHVVLEALTSKALNWSHRLTVRTFEWLIGNRTWELARRLAWGDLLNEWHQRHGRRWPA